MQLLSLSFSGHASDIKCHVRAKVMINWREATQGKRHKTTSSVIKLEY